VFHDVRAAVEKALRTWPDKTQQAIADQVGCSQQYVARLKDQFTTSSKLPEAPATVTGKDGKTYPTRKPRQKPEPEPDDEVGHCGSGGVFYRLRQQGEAG
jgi:hypothetical protein